MPEYTPSQKNAINSEYSKIVISASAGSGKTTVMIDRIIRLVLGKKASVDQILAVTFTKAAAKNMKDKLSSALIKNRTAENSEYLSEQIDAVSVADISTLHSFCANLLKTYFCDAGLDASFSVIDATDSKKLKDKALSNVFERLYEEENGDFETLVKLYSKNRKDDNLKKILSEIYEFIITEENPLEVLENALAYYNPEGLEKINAEVFTYFTDRLSLIISNMDKYEEYFRENGMPKTETFVRDFVQELTVLKSASSFSDFQKLCSTFVLRSVPSDIGTADERYAVKKRFSELKSNVKKILTEVSEYSLLLEGDKGEFFAVGNIVEKLFDLEKTFMEEFAELKREENVVDFNDLEHMTIKLLQNADVREEVRSKYKYVFVDECQDINGAQESILDAVSDGKLFMVGDIKQSIYSFRGCNPDLFDKKFREADTAPDADAIRLENNFRSSNKVLYSVNRIFKRVMTEKNCSVDYRANPMVSGGLYPEGEGISVLHLYNKVEEEDYKTSGVYDLEKHAKTASNAVIDSEGQVIVDIIREECCKGKKYYDIKDEQYKEITYKDVAILTRSTKENYTKIIDALILNGIPLNANGTKSIAEYPEISFLINLTELICLYNRDIPLVSVLKSPIGNFTEEELLCVRAKHPEVKSFSDAVTQYVLSETDEIAQRLKEFAEYFDKIRLLAEYEPAGELLTRIIQEKGVDLYYAGLPFGEERLKRINRFIEEAGSTLSIGQFLRRLDYVISEMSLSRVEGENAVKITSMHSSKGLEYPVVIVAGVGGKFPSQDVREEIYRDRRFGLSFKDYDYDNRTVKTKNPLRFLISKRMTARRTMEEMRLFYVALTRAKCRLHLVCEQNKYKPCDIEEELDVYSTNKYSDFINSGDFIIQDHGDCFGEVEAQEQEQRQILIGKSDEKLTDKIFEYLDFTYPWQKDINLPVKRSVSSAVKKEEDVFYERTSLFGEADTLHGNAYHKALELMDFYGDFQTEWNNLSTSPHMTEEYLSVIDKDKLQKIVDLPIFSMLDGYALYKEQPFTAYVSAKEITDTDSDGKILIQGIIDLLAIKDGNAVIVDYKYSTIAKTQDLIDKYRKQLELYSYAVNSVLGLKTKAYIVNINTMEYTEVK